MGAIVVPMKPSQNSLFKAATYVRAVAENGTLELVPLIQHIMLTPALLLSTSGVPYPFARLPIIPTMIR
jgi:hypothetical protein